MQNPVVSFVVPCYNLAGYLDQCIQSILNQTYDDWELLIMDDCSPDDTRSRAAGYRDSRVHYIRNEQNIGHLRNYNKGIAAAKGEYIWLISADDCLGDRNVLQLYVSLMTKYNSIVYTFCPVVRLNPDGTTGRTIEWTRPFQRDQVLQGREFLSTLSLGCCIASPSAMVRRSCYDSAGGFLLDIPHAGDWFLWCNFAFLGDVGYFAKPMVHYRVHDASMSAQMKRQVIRQDQAKVRWRVKAMAERAGFEEVATVCVEQLSKQYARDLAQSFSEHKSQSIPQVVESILVENVSSETERDGMRGRIFKGLADSLFGAGHRRAALKFYWQVFRDEPSNLEALAKILFLIAGKPGASVRRLLSRMKANGSIRRSYTDGR